MAKEGGSKEPPEVLEEEYLLRHFLLDLERVKVTPPPSFCDSILDSGMEGKHLVCQAKMPSRIIHNYNSFACVAIVVNRFVLNN